MRTIKTCVFKTIQKKLNQATYKQKTVNKTVSIFNIIFLLCYLFSD